MIRDKSSIHGIFGNRQEAIKHCDISGELLSLPSSYVFQDQTASLDRIDSSKGYIEGNVQWLHKKVNRIKWDLTQEEFLEWNRKIYEFNKEKF